jgi:hypothetical protein
MTVLTPGYATATAGLTLADPIAAVPIAGHADSGPATLAGAPAMAAAGHGGAPHDAAAHLWLGGVSVEGSLTSSSQDAPMVVTVIWTGPRPCRSALDASSS